MNIAKVTSIEDTGQPPYNSQHGLLYAFLVSFEDGVSGVVNAKSPSGPAYAVGDMVGYEITGSHAGVNKIKVDKKAAQGMPPTPQPPAAARSTPPAGRLAPPTTPSDPPASSGPEKVQGMTVGMAIKEALALLSADLTHEEIVGLVTSPTFWAAVHETASDIIRVALLLEKGKLAKPVRERAGHDPEKAPEPAPVAPRAGSRVSDRVAANLADTPGEEVPF